MRPPPLVRLRCWGRAGRTMALSLLTIYVAMLLSLAALVMAGG
ncbi:MAG: hypothetical protein AVDCRST_MAG59-3313 [uncultured Thermomicrobiales bacterium]|uniref:Uncharacterized protein n=1 Tax=uncultured Thermomicrobiales bacterium TaxID=1645740 RepID=A0A6J4V7E7_9BACT|nr:MAG: hypothetical protein AVDCRST_MAG59-3313 [uncultured Thermomicrobiales bacterium]